ncbi:MAG TPA: phosphoribosyltransferase family protein [bacterium]|nr:phosphoribosyltransferase family protein [bacterium]HPJ71531.1 phosphoribosyltransferase family protein [bacterium]HPQ66340.1 phosphoribosyltransferase family protein [bacterium]
MATAPILSRELIGSGEIRDRVAELGREIDAFYAGAELTVLPVLTGALLFAADLVRHLFCPVRIEPVSISSYTGTKIIGGTCRMRLGPGRRELEGRDVLIVDDIYDRGRTLAALIARCEEAGAARVRTCVLLRKDRPDLPRRPGHVDWFGFDIPNEFVAGYGLDYNGLYRQLPSIGVLNPEIR